MKQIVQLPEAPLYHNETTGEERLEHGYVVIGDGYYDVLDGVELKEGGTVVSSGDSRYADLDPLIADKILEALVTRDGKNIRIKMEQIVEGDEVLENHIIPHHWFGESLSNLKPDQTLPPEP